MRGGGTREHEVPGSFNTYVIEVFEPFESDNKEHAGRRIRTPEGTKHTGLLKS